MKTAAMSPSGTHGYVSLSSCRRCAGAHKLTPFQTGVIVKWSLFLGLIVVIGLYFLFGYLHAQKRLREGLPPLGYHRVRLSAVP